MTLHLVEGQDLSTQYSLLHRVSDRDGQQGWLALDKQLNERVFVKVFVPPLAAEASMELEAAVRRTSGLVHPNIVRLYGVDLGPDCSILASAYVRSARTFAPDKTRPSDRWQVLSQLFASLRFAHGLGLAHGHLHPGNLLLDDRNVLHITDFGLGLQHDSRYEAFLSPQVRRGDDVDISDDIYSIGQLLCVTLTGSEWRHTEQLATTSPIPGDVSRQILLMLSDSAYDRPRDLAVAEEVFRRFIVGDQDEIVGVSAPFSRAVTAATAPSVSAPVAARSSQRLIPAWWVVAALALLIVVAGALFILLPEVEPAVKTVTPAAVAPAPVAANSTEPTPLDRARQKQFEEASQTAATALLRLQVELEDVGVKLWAGEDFSAGVAMGTDADGAYRDDRFEDALHLYEKGLQLLQQVQTSIPEVYRTHIRQGDAAIADQDAEAAIRAFTVAIAIDPADSDSRRKLALAENLDALKDFLAEGEFLEADQQLDNARAKYARARALDGNWQPISAALARVDGKIRTRTFNDAMSRGMNAMTEARFDAAREAFNQAQQILPASTAPADGLAQIEVAIRQQTISSHRGTAEAEAAKEEWANAIAEYEKILSLDESLVFARTGRAEAEHRLALEERLKRLLVQPTLMADDAEFDAAKKTLVEASRIKERGPRLKQQIDDLSLHISLARIPMPLQLQSDLATDVTIYKVANLGKFQSTTVQLVPGAYKIVGTRRGYRDVEFDLTLIGGRPVPPVSISCTEKI